MNQDELKRELLTILPDADLEIVAEMIYCEWHGNQIEWDGLVAFKGIDDCFYVIEFGGCPLCSDDAFEPEEVTFEQVKKLIQEFEKERS